MGDPTAAPVDRFELGLVLAGTVSAGAYTAGVLDFLVQALDAWSAAKDADELPRHKVEIKAVAGASGGAMNAAILAASLFAEVEHYRHAGPDPAARKNRFFDAWVRQIDMSKLVDTRDLARAPTAPAPSLLDSTGLDAIALAALDVEVAAGRRDYVAPALDVFLTVTNLRGVDYRIDFSGGEAARFGQTMRNHADYRHFVVGDPPPAPTAVPAEPVPLDAGAVGPAGNWLLLRDAALATGAFPVGLQARRLDRPRTDYKNRGWAIPQEAPTDGACTRIEQIPQQWPDPDEMAYKFVCVDGGTINNEPLELARRALAGPGQRNPRQAMKARRAVLMIDPLTRPEQTTERSYAAKDGLLAVAGALVGMLVSQARFKADELRLARDDSVFSRFLIAPRRQEADDRCRVYPVFGELAGAFAAFLHEDFRRHDYRLGRRNCQRFLARYLVLPAGHGLFANWRGNVAMIDKYAVKRDDGTFDLWQDTDTDGNPIGEPQKKLPIVPLVAAVATAEPLPDRPDWRILCLDKEARRIAARLAAVSEHLIGVDLADSLGVVGRFLARQLVRWYLRRKMAAKLRQWLGKELPKLDLFA